MRNCGFFKLLCANSISYQRKPTALRGTKPQPALNLPHILDVNERESPFQQRSEQIG